MNKIFIFSAVALMGLASCKKDKKEESKLVPQFSLDLEKKAPSYKVIATSNDRVSEPWDLDFHTTRDNELWVVNKGTNQSGGTTVTLSNAGEDNQEADFRKDANSWHFMALPSSLAFSKENGNWATGADIIDANRQGGSFTGPSLWSSDMMIYARPSGGNGSHLDMLHGSPYSMGIENDKDNAFWVFDGFNEEITWYDFVKDHGPGNADHDDGVIKRYQNVKVKRKPGVASHMVKDPNSEWLYIVDAGNTRIIRMSTTDNRIIEGLPRRNEILAKHEGWEATFEVLFEEGFESPTGIEIEGNTLFVSDHDNGDIIAYDLETMKEIGRLKTGYAGIMGIVIGPDNKLWFANTTTSEIIRIDPN